MRPVRAFAALLMFIVLLVPIGVVLAGSPGCSMNSDGSISCTTGGGGNSGGGGSGGNRGGKPKPTPEPVVSCTPGATEKVLVYTPVGTAGQCSVSLRTIDSCTGAVLSSTFGGSAFGGYGACPQAAEPSPPKQPCTTLKVSAGAINCNANNGWHIKATVRFPETFLDVRPFPATLVRWPTAVRNGGMPGSSGSGSLGYYGSGSMSSPNVGDWSNIRLTLTLNPVSPMFVTLPHIGKLALPDKGASGTPQIIQWEVPSHPKASGGPTAGTVSGMNELPKDLPLFVGNGRSAYRLYWNLSYSQYEAKEGCVSGPNGAGKYNCGGGTGHKAVVGYEWRRHSNGGEIPPSAVANMPASVGADLNGDGMADAYWDHNLTLRRMDAANRVDNPTYRHSWNWGGLIYWGVREGQGQIGWPGGQ